MRWTMEHPVQHFHYVDPNAPWYGRLIRFFTNKCPWCKCLDLVCFAGARERVGCTACGRRWNWDDDDR